MEQCLVNGNSVLNKLLQNRQKCLCTFLSLISKGEGVGNAPLSKGQFFFY